MTSRSRERDEARRQPGFIGARTVFGKAGRADRNFTSQVKNRKPNLPPFRNNRQEADQ